MKEKIKVSLFAEDTILCFKNSNRLPPKLLKLISSLVAQKSMVFLYINNEYICRRHGGPCAHR